MDQRITRISMNEEDVNELRELTRMRKGTIEYLFKDYSGRSFETKLTNPIKPLGEEKW